MKAVELAKVFNPKEFEDRIYAFWLERGVFKPADGDGAPFVIVIPPPNVTGVLHMGHALNNCLQDILVRYYRMLGRPALWVPGTDHAGIATQNVVEKRLRAKGLSRHDLGREKFVEETWKVKDEHHAVITKQLKKLGASVDWSRERFTLDEGLSRAVREVFVTLYERDLIYQGSYLVNWCTSCGTAISDDEVEYHEVKGKMYHVRYPLEDGSGFVQVATTRPETMLGDTALAVNPEDERYTALHGKRVKLPLTDRVIPVIADSYVDREFGTGVVKITPAHDPNDFEVGNRHDLERINILNPDGTLSPEAPERFRGLTVKRARAAVIEELKAGGYLVKTEDHTHQVGHCYRCDTVIEPFLSKQWFVRMRPLAEKALGAWERGEVQFFPRKWENTYTAWLRNIRDWCISRQLWWGHRIPVWYCDECGSVIVSRTDPESCSKCGSAKLRQDPDVLDTWFSSWLWPFSTLGWPEKTPDLERFFPTTSLVTGYDIIFFWVARMIMAGMEFMGEAPFRDIYITGLVRDTKGRKMSKSLGNGIDPLEIIDEYGADALKFTFAFVAAQGQDVLIDRDTFKLGSKFANKVWNASRYILMNLEGRTLLPESEIDLTELDKWIYHRLGEAASAVRTAVESYRFNDAAAAVYEFFWNEFCDWYIESTKLSLYSGDEREKDRTVTLLISVLEESLRLLHPFLSFITEEIYRTLPVHRDCIATAPYPERGADRKFPEEAARYAALQELVRGVRTLRSEFTVPPERRITVHVRTERGFFASEFLRRHRDLVTLLVGASELVISDDKPARAGAIPVIGTGFESYVFIRDVIDVPSEIEKLTKEIEKTRKFMENTKNKLENPQFRDKAPEEIVRKERTKLEEAVRLVEKMSGYLAELKG
jgi:valyl-tRNA synthetase